VNDATWLADLLARGLIRGSFVPDEQTQEMRNLLRTRKQLVRECSRHIQRLQKTTSWRRPQAFSEAVGASFSGPPLQARHAAPKILIKMPGERKALHAAAEMAERDSAEMAVSGLARSVRLLRLRQPTGVNGRQRHGARFGATGLAPEPAPAWAVAGIEPLGDDAFDSLGLW
jgi:hypothetical protein